MTLSKLLGLCEPHFPSFEVGMLIPASQGSGGLSEVLQLMLIAGGWAVLGHMGLLAPFFVLRLPLAAVGSPEPPGMASLAQSWKLLVISLGP